MTGKHALLAGCAIFALAGAAQADCAAELAALEEGAVEATGGEIAKDGSVAPLQEDASAPAEAGGGAEATAADAGGPAGGAEAESAEAESAEAEGEIVKDGSVAPLEGEAGGASESVAMSPQDVEAQQQGDGTAMAEAEPGEADAAGFASRDEALEAAREALAEGDEAACREAVEAAKIL